MLAIKEETRVETPKPSFPTPFLDVPVGQLVYDGHQIDIWSIATTVEGKVIFLNGSGADSAISATLKRLLRKGDGKATFIPSDGIIWSGQTELVRLDEHYDTITSALTHQGLRLKNQCLLPDSANIAAGLARPMEVLPSVRLSRSDEEKDLDTFDPLEGALAFRYVLGHAMDDRPPTGSLFAHLKAMVVVCPIDWEMILWEHGLIQGFILPQPALGIRAWSILQDRPRWTDLVKELWMTGMLPRPVFPLPLSAHTRHRI